MKTTLSVVTLVASVAFVAGCDHHRSGSGTLVVERQALTIQGAPIAPVGVAVDPASGARFVLDASNRLYDLSLDGELTLKRDLAVDSWVGTLPLQDLCAVSDTELYTIAPDNGLRIEVADWWVTQHFCIVPDMEEWDENRDPDNPDPWVELRQETHAIACDPERALLFAQPQTLPRWDEDPQPVRSEVSLYDLPSGADLEWHGLPSEAYLAGGMAVVSETSVLLGRGSLLSRYDMESGRLEPVADLAGSGVKSIEGLAPDRVVGHLLVVDGDDGELVILDLGSLGLDL